VKEDEPALAPFTLKTFTMGARPTVAGADR